MLALSPQSLFSSASCYACYGASQTDALELALWDSISQNAGGVIVDPYDNKLVYTRDGVGVVTVDGPVGNYNLATGDISQIHCHNAPGITGLTVFTSLPLVTLDLVNLISISTISITICNSLTSIDLSSLNCPVVGVLDFNENDNLASINLNGITHAEHIDCSVCPLLTSVTASTLENVTDYFLFGSSGVTSISFPSLVSVDNNLFNFNNCVDLVSISLPLFEYSGGYWFGGVNCYALSSLYIPLFNGNGIAFDFTSLTEIDAPSLVTASDLYFPDSAALNSLNFPLLESAATLYISGTDINSVDLSAITSGMNYISAENNAVLTNFDIASVVFSANGTYYFYGCPLSESEVDAILAAAVAGGMSGGEIDVSGSCAPPSNPAGLDDITTLQNNGASVVYNV
jgi:hypothetical protein